MKSPFGRFAIRRAGPVVRAVPLAVLSLTMAAAGRGIARADGPARPAAPPSSHRPALFKDSRQTLAILRAQGQKDVVLLVVAKAGAGAAVAGEAKKLGGDIRYRDDEVGYFRVRLPIDRVMGLAEFGGVEAAAVDYNDNLPNRLTPGGQATPARSAGQAPAGESARLPLPPMPPGPGDSAPEWPPRLSSYPLEHPYSPVKDLDAADFLARHPTFDGRGVTIALLDGNFDLLLPEFQTAYTIDGKTVPKVADYLNLTDPRDDGDLNPQWVDMKETVTTRGGKVSFRGKTFTVPRDGTYRIGLFDERKFNMESNAAYIDQDIDRNGNPPGDDGLFGVLWDEKTNDVWVDTNRDLSFADEKAMTDYVVREDVGVFGKDDPKTPIRESVGFAVQTDKKSKFVSINVGVYQHATEIMGSVVGNASPNGRIHGMAPGARLVSMFYGVSNEHALIEGLIAAFRHPKVDLIVLEQSTAIASEPYLLADATHPMSVVAQRLTDRYKKLLFVPGNNNAAFGFVAEDGLAPGVVSVGGYQNKESYRANNGWVPENDDNMHWGALSHGPSGSGALKPDLLAASGQISTDPGYRMGGGSHGLFTLPPGYSIDGGTSTATPMAAGAAALVVSAAKQSGVAYDAVRLKAALVGSARHIARLGAHEQGNGLLQVAAAFELLQRLQSAQSIAITSRAPVRTKLSHLLRTPDEGVGLYEREGWAVGDRRDRAITLTRTSGDARPMTFALSWEGDDGTFESGTSVTLPLNEPVAVPVTIAAKSAGAHSAILTVDHASVPGHVHRVLATIVVAHRFTRENGYSIQTIVTPPMPGDMGVFVEVPPGTSALTYSASSPDAYLSLIGPDKDEIYPCQIGTGKPQTCAAARPQPGVYEINVATFGNTMKFDPEAPIPLKASPVTVTATVLGVDVTASPSSVDAKAGSSQALSLTLQNRLAKVKAGVSPAGLAQVRSERASLGQGEQHAYEVEIPKGTTSFYAGIRGVSDARADLDLYLLDCTGPEKKEEKDNNNKDEKPADSGSGGGQKSPMRPPPICGPVSKEASVGPDGEVSVNRPKPGRYVVVVDAFSTPSGPVAFEYFDAYTNPGFGSIAAADSALERSPSSRWTAQANLWSVGSPDSSRRLAARIAVTSPDVTRPGPGSGEMEPIPLGYAEVGPGAATKAAATRSAPDDGRSTPSGAGAR